MKGGWADHHAMPAHHGIKWRARNGQIGGHRASALTALCLAKLRAAKLFRSDKLCRDGRGIAGIGDMPAQPRLGCLSDHRH